MESINPATGEVIRAYPEATAREAEQLLELSGAAFEQWKLTGMAERSALMKKLQNRLLDRKGELATLITQEMGKARKEAMAEIEKCALVCSYYAHYAGRMLKSEAVATEWSQAWISYQPLGTVLAVMPWNFPFWQVFRFLAPNLMAGNTGVLKHASNVPGCALAIEQLVREAGFPEHVFRTLLVGSPEVKAVIEHPVIRAVTLTGSTPAGKAIASAAGAALKKTVLELGGSDAYLVLEDADVAEAARLCVQSRLLNAGQSCISAKRFIVTGSVYDAFRDEFIQRMSQVRWGDPMNPATEMGPLAKVELRDTLHHQVEQSRTMGARVLLGGEVPEGKGAFYPPTVMENVVPGMPAYHEELFGPVGVLYRVESEQEAIALANGTSYGLGAAVFTRDTARGRQLAEKGLEAGSVFVNELVKSDPRLPFGGVKESGYGRELSVAGIREFVNVKTVVVR